LPRSVYASPKPDVPSWPFSYRRLLEPHIHGLSTAFAEWGRRSRQGDNPGIYQQGRRGTWNGGVGTGFPMPIILPEDPAEESVGTAISGNTDGPSQPLKTDSTTQPLIDIGHDSKRCFSLSKSQTDKVRFGAIWLFMEAERIWLRRIKIHRILDFRRFHRDIEYSTRSSILNRYSECRFQLIRRLSHFRVRVFQLIKS
jgi:hypothetical protein